jgi:hypothetical protein
VQRIRVYGPASGLTVPKLQELWATKRRFSPEDQHEIAMELAKRSPAPLPAGTDRSRLPTTGTAHAGYAKPAGLVAASAGAAGAAAGLTKTALVNMAAPTSGAGAAAGLDVLGVGIFADAALNTRAGYARMKKAEQEGDKAGVNVGAATMRSGGWGVAGGAVSTTSLGVKTGITLGSHAVGLASAAGGLGIAGSALSFIQGGWRAGKAAQKLWRLRAVEMLSKPGPKWKERVDNREKWKLGVNALKAAAGALGIVAGALLLANPVGAAVAITALLLSGLVVGVGIAVGKIANKVKDSFARRKAKKLEQVKPENIELRKPDVAPTPERRKQVKKMADNVAKMCSENARVAGAMRGALVGLGDPVHEKLNGIEILRTMQAGAFTAAEIANVKANFGVTEDRKEASDAAALLGVLNIEPDEAVSESGQERIEKKLSVAESA